MNSFWRKITNTILLTALLAPISQAADSSFTLRSPDDRIEVQIHVANRITYDVALNGKPLLAISVRGRARARTTQTRGNFVAHHRRDADCTQSNAT